MTEYIRSLFKPVLQLQQDTLRPGDSNLNKEPLKLFSYLKGFTVCPLSGAGLMGLSRWTQDHSVTCSGQLLT